MNPQIRRRQIDGPVRRLDSIGRLKPAPHLQDPSNLEEPDLIIEEHTSSLPGSMTPAMAGAAPVSPAAVLPAEPVRLRPPRARRITLRQATLFLLAILLLIGAAFGTKLYLAARKIMADGSGKIAPALLGDLDPTKLRGEGDGRVNILLLGIGGSGHEAPNLSDTIMVASFDPKTKDVAMLSVPRDLYVKIPGKGYGKINSAHASGGPATASKVVSKVIDQPIHYYAVVDFAGFKRAIDAVGGIEVTVDEPIYDPSYPCDRGRGVCPLRIKAGKQHMNGTIALRYARSRKSTSDFDRAKRQQKVLVALRAKAMQASTLSNPVKLSGLVDALGSHVKTDLQFNEIKKLAENAKDVDPSKIQSHVLDTSPSGLLVDGTGRIPGAGSIELPKAGTFDYSQIQDFVKNIFVDRYITGENAIVEIQNGTGVEGLAGTAVRSLKAAHYNVLEPTNAGQLYSRTFIYDYSGGKKPFTVAYLEKRFGVKAQKGALSSAPGTAETTTSAAKPDIRIVIGSDYRAAAIGGEAAATTGAAATAR